MTKKWNSVLFEPKLYFLINNTDVCMKKNYILNANTVMISIYLLQIKLPLERILYFFLRIDIYAFAYSQNLRVY